MPGTLYIVTTPIGNLSDMTPRAAATFEVVDFIAAEDTRVTVKLLNYLGLKKPMISYYAHNATQKAEEILARIVAGESCALCSDAGVPAISDPGEELVMQAHTLGIRVVPIPAACAAIAALCVSGQITSRFVFEGFLPQNRQQRKKRLDALAFEQRTILFYEAPHKLLRTLQDFQVVFGGQRSLTICRELTKLHEEIRKTTIEEALAYFIQTPPRGEFVLVLEGAAPPQKEEMSLEDGVALALGFAKNEGLSASEAAKKAAKQSGINKSILYKNMQL